MKRPKPVKVRVTMAATPVEAHQVDILDASDLEGQVITQDWIPDGKLKVPLRNALVALPGGQTGLADVVVTIERVS